MIKFLTISKGNNLQKERAYDNHVIDPFTRLFNISDSRRFRNNLRDVPSLRLSLPSYKRVSAKAPTRLNALEVASLSDICLIVFSRVPNVRLAPLQK